MADRIKIVCCIVVFLNVALAAKRCPSNLPSDPSVVEYPPSNSCYEFVTTHSKDWIHAEGDCAGKGGHLARIDNIVEENFFMSHLRSLQFSGTGVWIGLSDQTSEGTFTWNSGGAARFSYWGIRQGPSAGLLHFAKDIEDCVVLKFTDSGHWHDYPCSALGGIFPENFQWVCQYAMISTDTTTTIPDIIG